MPISKTIESLSEGEKLYGILSPPQHHRRSRRQIEQQTGLAVEGGGVVGYFRVDVAEAVVSRVVRVQDDAVAAGRAFDGIFGVGFLRVEVEDNQTVATLERQHLVALVLAEGNRSGVEQPVFCDAVDHIPVETVQTAVFQQLIVGQIPLAAGMVEGPSVVLPREVDPLRMTELIAHEVEVATGA